MFALNFSVSQSQDGTTLTIKDLSVYSGADVISNIASRNVVLTTYGGVAPGAITNPVNFPISAGTNDTVNVTIDKDYAVAITVTDVPVVAQAGSVYTLTQQFALINFSKLKLYDREVRLANNLVVCDDDFEDVDYTIIRFIDDATERLINSDQLGSQRYLDKINSIGVNDCTC